GPDAKLRVWVVLDGDVLYLDRDRNGDLTGKDERFETCSACSGITIRDPDGRTSYLITSVGVYSEKTPSHRVLDVAVDIKGPLSYGQYCNVALPDSPAKAAVAHFHGPLTVGPRTLSWEVPPTLALVVGDTPADLPAVLGTMSAEHGCWVVVRSHNGEKSA